MNNRLKKYAFFVTFRSGLTSTNNRDTLPFCIRLSQKTTLVFLLAFGLTQKTYCTSLMFGFGIT